MTTGRIDVHAHFLPAGYRAAAEAAGHQQPDGFPTLPEWDVDRHVEVLDRLDIAVALLSISSPGVHFGDEAAARSLAREVNEAGYRAIERHPTRFGQLASLPLPDVEGTLDEIAHAYDTLDVDGVALLTNADGTYLGDATLEPVFDELDRRHARVFIHPTSPLCWEHTSFGRPRPMLEFLFDTTRAVVNLVLNGTIARHPNIEIIVPHAGATLPAIADRVAAFSTVLGDVDPAADVMRDLARLHYDLAGFPIPRQLDALRSITTLEHLHYGSDYPFTSAGIAGMLVAQLDDATTPAGSVTAALSDNTRRLFPSLARLSAIPPTEEQP
jgi:predicted TIM-barrel fold metal-dependent hydrolase